MNEGTDLRQAAQDLCEWWDRERIGQQLGGAPEPLFRLRRLLAGRRPTDLQPHPIDLCQELRKAVGLFDGAMVCTPKEAWDEAIARAKDLAKLARGTTK